MNRSHGRHANPGRRLGVAATASLWAATLSAQTLPVSVLPAPNLDLTQPGRVQQILRQEDGQWLVLGSFRRLGGIERSGLARLLPDGSVDPTFIPASSIDGSLLEAVQRLDDGRHLVLAANTARRLLANGDLDTGFTSLLFNPTFARSAAVVDDGIVVVGNFTQVLTNPATAANRMAKLNADGTLVSSFAVGLNGAASVVRATGPAEVIVGGTFSQAAGQPRTGLAKVDTAGNGALDTGWNPVLASNSGAPSVQDLLVVDDAVYVSGQFDSVNGVPRKRLAKLSLSNGTVDPNWSVTLTTPSSNTLKLARQGTHLVIGSSVVESLSNPPGAVVQRQLARVSLSAGTIDAAFNPVFTSSVATPIVAAEGDAPSRLLVGSNFNRVGTTSRFALGQLDAAGALDPLSAHPEALDAGTVSKVIVDPISGRTYLAGSFRRVGTAERRFAVRLTPAGLVDSAWRPQTDERASPAMALVPGQGVFIAGNNGILRLDEVEGNAVPGWSNTFVATGLVAGDDEIYAIGVDGLRRFPLAGGGASDLGFNPTLATSISELVFDAPGNSLLLNETTFPPGGGIQTRIIRLDASTGSRMTGFDPLLQSGSSILGAQGMAVDGNGLWVAGNFTTVNGQTRASPVRLLLADGEIDPSVAPTTGTAFNNGLGFHRGFFYGFRPLSSTLIFVRRVAAAGGAVDSTWLLDTNGVVNDMDFDGLKILIGGGFTRVGAGQLPRNAIAAVLEAERILGDGFE